MGFGAGNDGCHDLPPARFWCHPVRPVLFTASRATSLGHPVDIPWTSTSLGHPRIEVKTGATRRTAVTGTEPRKWLDGPKHGCPVPVPSRKKKPAAVRAFRVLRPLAFAHPCRRDDDLVMPCKIAIHRSQFGPAINSYTGVLAALAR